MRWSTAAAEDCVAKFRSRRNKREAIINKLTKENVSEIKSFVNTGRQKEIAKYYGEDSMKQQIEPKTKCYCGYCLWEGTSEELKIQNVSKIPTCPKCDSFDVRDGEVTGAIPLNILEDIRDWLITPQTTGGNFPMETNKAESEDLDHVLVSVIKAIEDRRS